MTRRLNLLTPNGWKLEKKETMDYAAERELENQLPGLELTL